MDRPSALLQRNAFVKTFSMIYGGGSSIKCLQDEEEGNSVHMESIHTHICKLEFILTVYCILVKIAKKGEKSPKS